jgi:hypothetical protein
LKGERGGASVPVTPCRPISREAGERDGSSHHGHIRIDRGLLLSIDGCHAVDSANCTAAPAASRSGEADAAWRLRHQRFDHEALRLFSRPLGTTHRRFVFYDDGYDRNFFPAGSNSDGTSGTEMNYPEPLDTDPHRINSDLLVTPRLAFDHGRSGRRSRLPGRRCGSDFTSPIDGVEHDA